VIKDVGSSPAADDNPCKLIKCLPTEHCESNKDNNNNNNNTAVCIPNIYRRRRRLGAIEAYGLALAVVQTAIAILPLLESQSSWGVAIEIDNWWKSLNLVAEKVYTREADEKSPHASVIKASHKDIAGGFIAEDNDIIFGAGQTPGVAGLVSYSITDPKTKVVYIIDIWFGNASMRVLIYWNIKYYVWSGMAIVVSQHITAIDDTKDTDQKRWDRIFNYIYKSVRDSGNWDNAVSNGLICNYLSKYDHSCPTIAYESRAHLQTIEVHSPDKKISVKGNMANADVASISVQAGPFQFWINTGKIEE